MRAEVIGPYRPASQAPLPFYESAIPAGFPSAADDYLDRSLDLHALVVEHPAATFFVRVEGDSMREAKIESGDILVVDRAITPVDGKIVVALLDGEFTVKRLKIQDNTLYLVAENPCYQPIKIEKGSDFQIWGTVTYVIHRAC